MTSQSKWIWCTQQEPCGYNLTALFQKEFESGTVKKAVLRITADSFYRVSLNGVWLNDGPAKAYPNHYTYDEHDIAPFLKKEGNRLEVTVRYFGVGTFHQIPQQAGLWAELELDGETSGTDASWLAAPANAWKQWTPKISHQMEAIEEYDARLEKTPDWESAVEYSLTGTFSPRGTELLTQNPRRFKDIRTATVVKKSSPTWCMSPSQLAHQKLITANFYTSCPVVLGSVLSLRRKQTFNFSSAEWKVAVNGRLLKSGKVTLSPGKHTVLFFLAELFLYEKVIDFPFRDLPGATWGVWNVQILENLLFRGDDMVWLWFKNEQAEALKVEWAAEIERISSLWKSSDEPFPLLGQQIDGPENQLFMGDFFTAFHRRKPLHSALGRIDGKIIHPSPKGDVELSYDLGEQSCGYLDFTIKAEAGVVVDFALIEYITPDGTLQHTLPFNRNGMRYTTKKGINRFTSLKRRAGQHLFVTLRNQTTSVEIRSLRLIEATAPVDAVGSFECSDPMLTRLWTMSERTLKLCMEDTFTDCPLYEQTLWTGDARNEALYAFVAYGNYDVSARSLELGAQSLEYFPLVGCQVPSSWDCLIPAWSFLWGLHVWEHYFYSGNKRLLKKLWPAVQKNLAGAESFIDESGLFSATLWNLLDWAPMDREHATVLHNSMLLVEALHAAEQCAEALGEEAVRKAYSIRRNKLIYAIQGHWNAEKKSYPDAMYDNGTPSPETCQHTSMLAIMCGIEPVSRWKPLVENLIRPPDGMVTIGTPFAMQFMYEALEAAGEFDAVLDSIHTRFQPMIDAGASTVWEMFPGSDFNTQGFPTRSHCHAWASSPIYFLNRIVLGIRQTAVGGKAFEISPRMCGLTQASGATAIPQGAVQVKWTLRGKSLKICVAAPKGVKVEFKSNTSHNGLEVDYQGVNKEPKKK